MTSCGTIANATALWCARSRLFPPAPEAPNVEHDGLKAVLDHHDCERAVILASNLAHYSVEKAAGRLGLGASNLLRVPVDARQRLELPALRKLVAHCHKRRWRIVAIVAVAGTTDCGSIDPLAAVAEIAAGEGVHYHVDAAWGGGLLFSEKHRSKLEGIECADSITLDAHKQLHMPIGLSLVLLRDPATARAMEIEANYMLRDDSGDLGRVSMEGSRPGMALFLHAALEIFGRSGTRSWWTVVSSACRPVRPK
jgi:glutamate/tyrosine decarboxylase-like PLP-dependent enzyme